MTKEIKVEKPEQEFENTWDKSVDILKKYKNIVLEHGDGYPTADKELDTILKKFPNELEDVIDGGENLDEPKHDTFYKALLGHYMHTGEMDYNVMTGDEGRAHEWVQNELEGYVKQGGEEGGESERDAYMHKDEIKGFGSDIDDIDDFESQKTSFGDFQP
jgi:hypothetical protein|tara:strand:- start:47 stop:526 length:480 start_codon:yes stop_codon:yes gene_type:complete